MEHIEIERKFLITSELFKQEATSKTRIVQGFLNTDPDRTVRVRISDDRAKLTVKGRSSDSGTSRFEWETEIPLSEATNLIDLCEGYILEKIRYNVVLENHLIEVDEFLGENKGLLLAEIELKYEEEPFKRPAWLGEEVTGDIRYYNSQLSRTPYNQWKN